MDEYCYDILNILFLLQYKINGAEENRENRSCLYLAGS
jgi:hypothetical protein